MAVFILTRPQAHALAWAMPMLAIASEVGTSNVTVAKEFREADIAVPPRGHWAKLAAGKPSKVIPLAPPEIETVMHVRLDGAFTRRLRDVIPGEPGDEDSYRDIGEMLESFRARLKKIRVSPLTGSLHPQIKRLLDKDERERAKNEILAKEHPSFAAFMHRTKYDSPEERRRLRIINAIFLAFAKFGGHGHISGDDAHSLSIGLGDKHASFQLSNSRSGALVLSISPGRRPDHPEYRWADHPGERIEDQLNEVVVRLAEAAELQRRAWQAEIKMVKERDRLETQRLAREAEQRRIQQVEQERRQAERKQVRDLIRAAAGFQSAEAIRAFVSKMLAASTDDTAALQAWATWATRQADKLDPLLNDFMVDSLKRFGLPPPKG